MIKGWSVLNIYSTTPQSAAFLFTFFRCCCFLKPVCSCNLRTKQIVSDHPGTEVKRLFPRGASVDLGQQCVCCVWSGGWTKEKFSDGRARVKFSPSLVWTATWSLEAWAVLTSSGDFQGNDWKTLLSDFIFSSDGLKLLFFHYSLKRPASPNVAVITPIMPRCGSCLVTPGFTTGLWD